MGDGFRGVSAERDGRFKLAEKKLMAKMKFPPEFSQKVDMSKVHLDVLRPWVAKKVFLSPSDFENDEANMLAHVAIARADRHNNYYTWFFCFVSGYWVSGNGGRYCY